MLSSRRVQIDAGVATDRKCLSTAPIYICWHHWVLLPLHLLCCALRKSVKKQKKLHAKMLSFTWSNEIKFVLTVNIFLALAVAM